MIIEPFPEIGMRVYLTRREKVFFTGKIRDLEVGSDFLIWAEKRRKPDESQQFRRLS